MYIFSLHALFYSNEHRGFESELCYLSFLFWRSDFLKDLGPQKKTPKLFVAFLTNNPPLSVALTVLSLL